MTPRFVIGFLLTAVIFTASSSAQQQSSAGHNLIAVPQQLQAKLASGRLLFDVARAMDASQAKLPAGVARGIPVAIYMAAAPTPAQLSQLEQTGVVAYPGTWTPPMDNHPRGFFLADMPAARLNDVLALASIQLLGSAASANRPMNNVASRTIRANAAWSKGWTGKGVKVGVLDSGIDTSYQNGEFPACFDRKNYSKFPTIDNDVINRITPHGTHVAGTAVGRGILSAANTGNEGLAYRGIAPESCLAFLKIGDDSSAGASDAVIIAALHDAVTTYHARVINLSYGGWSTYHDGSEALEQKADWCYTQGAALAFSAGNAATGNRHAMGTVPANGETDFIEVRSWNIAADQSRLSFNLVWYDGFGVQRKLSLKYFDANKVEITNLNAAPVTESPRGTQSQYTSMKDFLPEGNATFYLKVANASGDPQVYHIYEDWFESTWKNAGSISFQNPSSAYTIGSPSTADHVFSIAAYCDRSYWTSALGQMRQYSQALDKLATFSSRGPRVDGRAKPDIAAPGTALISVRDTNTMRTTDNSWVDNDGTPGGDAHYTVMQGTSMAAPVATGAMALILSKYPTLTPQQVYDSLRLHARLDLYTGTAANNNWGAGKMDLGFLSDMPRQTSGSGWTTISTSWSSKDVADVAIHYKGIFVTVGKPWTNDSTTLLRSKDNGVTWSPLKTDVGLIPIAIKKSDSTLYTAQRFAGHGFKSTNLGMTWTQWGDALDYTSLLFAAGDSLLLAGTYGQGIRYSTDGAATWSTMNAGIPNDAQVPILTDGRNGWMYACVNINGSVKLYRLHRSTMIWFRSDTGIDTTRNVNGCTVMPDGTVFAIVWDRIYRSLDNGATWTQTAILNDYLQSVCAISNSTLLVGTVGAGTYRSTDGGNTWGSFNGGLTTLNITSMRNYLYGSTFAAGKPASLFRRTFAPTPAIPKLHSPINNAPATPSPVILVWVPVGDATSYTIEVSEVANFSIIRTAVDGIPDFRWSLRELPVQSKFYWRVRANNDGGSSAWSEVWNFTTADLPPATPLQLLPLDKADSVAFPITLGWTPVQTARTYRVEIATDSLFNRFFIRTATTTTQYVDSAYSDEWRYFWRVRAENPGGVSAWSPVWSFTSGEKPDTTSDDSTGVIPVLQDPAENAVNVPVAAHFTWLPKPGALSYGLQVATDTSFTVPLVNETVTVPQYTAYALPFYTRLYWRLRAVYIGKSSRWSQFRTFTTTLAGPSLKLPRQYATDVYVNPTFTWDATTGATQYRLQVSKDQAWGLPVFDTSGVTGLTYRTIGLNTSTQYYWRVFGLNADGQGESSQEWQFTTSSSTGVEDPLLASGVTLEQNYPNPARDVTNIRFQVRREGDVMIRMFDVLGREVVTLLKANVQPGVHDILIDVRSLLPGLYICRFSSGTSVTERALTIIR